MNGTSLQASWRPWLVERLSVEEVEEVEKGEILAPHFDNDGLIPVVTTDAESGMVLMMGIMRKP